jgi:hypothetical protein
MSISVEKLEHFIVNAQPDLETIKRDLSAFNIFTVLGIQHREIRHSNFLGWLFDPNESHQLGDVFLKDLFKLIRDKDVNEFKGQAFVNLLLHDLSTTQVYRESLHNIDILIVNEKLGFAICIENKINADFSDHQLEKYYNYVEENYLSLPTRIYLTLTPFRSKNHLNYLAGDNYTNITYQNIIDILKSRLEIIETTIPTVKESIKQYIAMTEKTILHNSDEVKLAQNIYKKYKNEIEFIIKNKPDFLANKQEIVECFNNGGLGDFEIIKNEHHKDIIRILPKNEKIKALFRDERFQSWGGNYMFCFEFFVQKNHIWLKWCFGDIRPKNEDLQQKKTKMVNIMKNFDCFKNAKIDKHEANPKDAFTGICGVNLFYYETYVNQDKELIDFLKDKFEEVNYKLIQPWIKECEDKL